VSSTSAPMGMQYRGANVLPVPTPANRYLRFGPFYLDMVQQELFKDGSRIRVQGKVCEALIILLEKPGEVITREVLRARLWPKETQINHDANVNTTVNKLRQILGDSPERPVFVETIPRKGYTFIAGVEPVDTPAFVSASAAAAEVAAAPAGLEENMLQRSTRIFQAAGGAGWFTAGAVSLLVGAMLFGAAIVLYAHR
jgi:DNA-binding winged helix-turn-helix (wHTH) protein